MGQTQHYSKLIMCKENNQSKAREQINRLQMYVLTKHSNRKKKSLSCANGTIKSPKINSSYVNRTNYDNKSILKR
jgi:hypothetical protein